MSNVFTQPLVAVDIGNSSTKYALFRDLTGDALPEPKYVLSLPTMKKLPADFVSLLPDGVHWHVASVHRAAERGLSGWVKAMRRGDTYKSLTYRDVPLAVEVEFPDRVGLDRLVAAAAANHLRRPEAGAVVVDAGSAVTVDLVNPEGTFLGGTILPGFRMGAQVLSQMADQLPLTTLETAAEPPPLPGRSTEAAIRAGLFWGAVGAVREIIHRYEQLFPDLDVFITGGDLRRLAPLVGERAKFISHLVVAGIALARLNPPPVPD